MDLVRTTYSKDTDIICQYSILQWCNCTVDTLLKFYTEKHFNILRTTAAPLATSGISSRLTCTPDSSVLLVGTGPLLGPLMEAVQQAVLTASAEEGAREDGAFPRAKYSFSDSHSI